MLAYKAELSHLLSNTLKLSTSVISTASGREHTIEISHILPKKVELGLKGQYVSGQAGMPNTKNLTLNVSYPAPKAYSLGGFTDTAQELKNWIDKPVIYATRVLAIKDEMVMSYRLDAQNWPDQTLNLDEPEQKITPLVTTDTFKFDDPSLQLSFSAVITSYPSGQEPPTLESLNLELVSTGPNQATLRSKDSIPPTTLPTTDQPYVITVTGTGTRPGLATPLVATATFKLYLSKGGPTWVTPGGPLQFDATPAIHDANPDSHSYDGVPLVLDIDGAQIPANLLTFDFGSSKSTAASAYWTFQKYNSGSTETWYLMRNTDSNGKLNAADVGSEVPLTVCAHYNGSSTCIPGSLKIEVLPDPNTRDGKSVIVGNVATAFTTTSGAMFDNWQAASNLITAYQTPASTQYPILADAFSNFANAAIVDWEPGIITISSAGTMAGTAPITPKQYTGTFEVKSKSAGGPSGPSVVSGFAASVGNGPTPDLQPISGEIRFDLTNGEGKYDPGLTPQPSEYEKLIDVTTMVKNMGSGSGEIPLENLVFNFGSSIGPWQLVKNQTGVWGTVGHTLLIPYT